MRHWKGILRWPLVVLVVGLVGCDLEVLNPGSIPDEDLNTEDLMPILATGVSGEYNDVQDLLAMEVSRLTDDIAGTGSYSTTQTYRQGIIDNRDTDGYWEQIHEAIWSAGEAWDIFQEVLPNPETNANSARLFQLMGHGHNRLGENYCDVVYDVGSVQPREAAFDSAIIAFNRAIQIGGSVGSAYADTIVWSAYAGIAQAELGKASLGAGTWQAAFDAAQDFFDNGGTEQFFDNAIYHAQANTNYVWNETHGRAELGVWSTRAQMLHDATGDVRVPYTKCGEWVDTSRPNPDPADGVDALSCSSGSGAHQGADGLTAHYRQDKYPDRGSEIPRASGVEMRLIQAEAMLMMGDISAATGMTNYLNMARASYGDPADTGLDPLAEPASVGALEFYSEYPHYAADGDADWDAWSMLDQERYATVWLEGKRFFDLDRWQHPFLNGGFLAVNVPGAGAVDERPSCMPIPFNECELNPNITNEPACS